MEENITEPNVLAETLTEATPVAQTETHLPEDVAAAFFRMERPRLQALLSQMSAKQMRRVMLYVCSYPFVDGVYRPKDNEEKVAVILDRMLYNKAIMQLSWEIKKVDESNAKENQNKEGEASNG